jgi:hypothetical protein
VADNQRNVAFCKQRSKGAERFATSDKIMHPRAVQLRSFTNYHFTTMSQTTISFTDLTQRPPRSTRTRLGGYVLLPRMLDKCRAELHGKNGEYHYNCPLDQRFFAFTGIDHAALKTEVAKGLGDGEILAWIEANAPIKHSDHEIAQWSAHREAAAPSDNDSRAYVSECIAKAGGAAREDLATWFEWLDFDDFVSYGGKA